jgi:hypothetical protein
VLAQFLPPHRDTTLLVALVAVGIAMAALMTRPDIPQPLLAALHIFGSVLLGGSLICPTWFRNLGD